MTHPLEELAGWVDALDAPDREMDAKIAAMMNGRYLSEHAIIPHYTATAAGRIAIAATLRAQAIVKDRP